VNNAGLSPFLEYFDKFRIISNLLPKEVMPLPVMYLQIVYGELRVNNTALLGAEAFTFL